MVPFLDVLRMRIILTIFKYDTKLLLRSDRGGARTLKALSFTNTTGMTPALHTQFCSDSGFGFWKVEFSQVKKCMHDT